MAQHFRAPERRQKLLLPADLMEWLPEDDIVHLIVETVEMMRTPSRSTETSTPACDNISG